MAGMAQAGAGEPEVHRITAANKPHSDDLDGRLSRYLLSMLFRTVCFILMFAVHGWVRWLFAVFAIFLPYVAVIFANAGGTRREKAPPGVAPRPAGQLTAQPFDPEQVRIYRPDEEEVAEPAAGNGTATAGRATAGGGPARAADAPATAGGPDAPPPEGRDHAREGDPDHASEDHPDHPSEGRPDHPSEDRRDGPQPPPAGAGETAASGVRQGNRSPDRPNG